MQSVLTAFGDPVRTFRVSRLAFRTECKAGAQIWLYGGSAALLILSCWERRSQMFSVAGAMKLCFFEWMTAQSNLMSCWRCGKLRFVRYSFRT
jgi:hypothetical protein